MRFNWNSIIGCPAVYDEKGNLVVFQNAKVIKLMGGSPKEYRPVITQVDKNYVYMSDNFCTLSRILKKFVKII